MSATSPPVQVTNEATQHVFDDVRRGRTPPRASEVHERVWRPFHFDVELVDVEWTAAKRSGSPNRWQAMLGPAGQVRTCNCRPIPVSEWVAKGFGGGRGSRPRADRSDSAPP